MIAQTAALDSSDPSRSRRRSDGGPYVPRSVRSLLMAILTKVLPHKDERKVPQGAPLVLDVSNS